MQLLQMCCKFMLYSLFFQMLCIWTTHSSRSLHTNVLINCLNPVYAASSAAALINVWACLKESQGKYIINHAITITLLIIRVEYMSIKHLPS